MTTDAIEPSPLIPTYDMANFIFSGPLEHANREGRISDTELQHWWADQEKIDADGQAFSVHMGYIFTGTK